MKKRLIPFEDVVASLGLNLEDTRAAETLELQPHRDLYNTLLDLSATLEDWEFLANPLNVAQADLAKALSSPVFDPIRREDEFLDEGADTE